MHREEVYYNCLSFLDEVLSVADGGILVRFDLSSSDCWTEAEGLAKDS